ncbi:MAG: hypothetical protein HPY55_08655 [Firmicutes bacterium]|nr:hypothetical protein [Bacillota bacterium]
MRRLCATLLALMVMLGTQVAHASAEIVPAVPPREITVQEYVIWHQALAAKLEALLTAYEGSLKAFTGKNLTQDQFRQRLMELSIAAAEVLRDSTSVTNTKNPELWGRITGDAALVAMVYSDIVLTFGKYAGGDATGGDDRLNTTCDLLRQAVATITGRNLVTSVQPAAAAPGDQLTPDTALFSQYFKNLSVGRLPAEVTKQDKANWRNHLIQTDMFSYGDIFAMTGEVLKEVRLTIAYVDVNSGRLVGSAGETPPLKPGPFTGYNLMALPPGSYEVRCFINGTLVRVLPFSALSPGSRVSM